MASCSRRLVKVGTFSVVSTFTSNELALFMVVSPVLSLVVCTKIVSRFPTSGLSTIVGSSVELSVVKRTFSSTFEADSVAASAML